MGCYSIHYQWTCYKKNIDDISHRGDLMRYVATTGVILYWKPDKPFVINRAHNIWFE